MRAFHVSGLILIGLVARPAFSQSSWPTWRFDGHYAREGFATERGTPRARRDGEHVFSPTEFGGGVVLDDGESEFVVFDDLTKAKLFVPKKALSVEAWVSIDKPTRWGGIVSCVQDNGGYEKGWVLGYDERAFTFAVSTEGADDGDGLLTYVTGEGAYEIGRWHHVVGTFDGATTRLYVDGELAGESEVQSGRILYDDSSPMVIGAYRDSNERHVLDGRIREVSLGATALDAEAVRARYRKGADRASLAPWTNTVLEWLVDPFLIWPRIDGMSVVCETNMPTKARLTYWHESGSPRLEMVSSGVIHTFRIEELSAGEKYFYQIAAAGSQGGEVETELLSFRTAPAADQAFTFVAIGDTQDQPEVVKRVSDLGYMHRPNLMVHAGDLVSTGSNKSHWTGHFFPNMQPLLGRVPMMPVLGNHEQDAKHYYDYMDLPEPESYYSFTFANSEFFMIDGNRPLRPGSDQLAWLEGALKASEARWRFAVLHQPPYTSDSNDYGDTTKGTSNRGDPNVQNIIKLLEQYGVDICFSGHVHDYERTFPILDGRVTTYDKGGVVYITVAGGGGSLEDFDPANTPFGHKKARYHHLAYIAVNGDYLEFQAIDENGRLFDVFSLYKRDDERRHRSFSELHEHDENETP